uniref:Uncharacterized protein n=1 Tax=Anguilla anguilla TaxID=7936 RepID=A0A0E9UDG0_ANGAN
MFQYLNPFRSVLYFNMKEQLFIVLTMRDDIFA